MKRVKGTSEQLSWGLRKGGAGIALVMASGVVGYRLIESWPWIDCFYMTVITVSTVGIMEVHPLSDAGRLFTILLILFET